MKTKLDLYKEHRTEYVTPKTPALVTIKRAKYLTITGQGEPGGEVFSLKLSALYNVAFTLKIKTKLAGQDYKVCGLEGLWWGRHRGDFLKEPRETWNWKLIIRTPDFITAKDVKTTIAELLKKRLACRGRAGETRKHQRGSVRADAARWSVCDRESKHRCHASLCGIARPEISRLAS